MVLRAHPVHRVLYSTVTGHDMLEMPCNYIVLAKGRGLFRGIEE